MEKKGNKNSKPTSVDKKSGGTKTGSTKKEDSGKRAPSGYILFGKDERSNVLKDNPEMKAKDVMTELGKRWNSLSDKEKKKYNDKAADEKAKMNGNEKSHDKNKAKPQADEKKKTGGKKKKEDSDDD